MNTKARVYYLTKKKKKIKNLNPQTTKYKFTKLYTDHSFQLDRTIHTK